MGPYRVIAKAETPKRTGADGRRAPATSAWKAITLGEDEAFNPADRDVYRVRWIARQGDTAWEVEWDDHIEVAPGLRLPRTLRFRISSRATGAHPLDEPPGCGGAEAELTAWSTLLDGRRGRTAPRRRERSPRGVGSRRRTVPSRRPA